VSSRNHSCTYFIFAEGESGQEFHSAVYYLRSIPDEIYKQLINNDGHFIRKNEYGKRVVAYAQKQGKLAKHALYFKVFPGMPGIEEAVGSFTRQLLGFGAPYTDLMKYKDYVVLVSQAIEGESLHDVLISHPDKLKQLVHEEVAGLIIAAMLVNPEDGKPDNCIYYNHHTAVSSFIPIF
jgi:hypothetical protein